ncbi:hypothetical protein HYV44_02755 [Candidatus Microgenomates bacterium]|nr:hypothetical protein [Candidatus Microgenomates bacterium]
MRQIIAAILAKDIQEFEDKLAILSVFADNIQLDIADGDFVDNKTVELASIKNLPQGKKYEAHLMTTDPLDYLVHCKRLGIEKVIIHDEIEKDTGQVLDKIKESGLKVFLGLNQETAIGKIAPHVDRIDGVLLMAVPTGFDGQEFAPQTIEKIKALRELYPDLIIEIDGGVNLNNIEGIFSAGTNIVAVGSGILKAENPKEIWEKLQFLTQDKQTQNVN